MRNKVITFIKKMNMIQEKDKVIVGISGGADSVCLLFVLLEFRKRMDFELIGVHVNHGIRQEASQDEAFVKQMCEREQVKYYSFYQDVKALAAEQHLSEEEAGRLVRRQTFEQVMQKEGATKIALAHHQNDNAETLLFHLARGTGLQGLCGIAPVNGAYIRPLLCVSRKEIEDFLEKEEIPFCVDRTNLTDDYTRNRIRNHIIPSLEEMANPAAVAHINDTMQQLRLVHEYLQEQVYIYQETCVKEEEKGYIVKKDLFQMVPKVLKPMLIKNVLADVAGQAKDLETIHFRTIEELFDKQVGRQLDMPYEISVRRTYEGVWIGRRKAKDLPDICVVLEPEIGKTKCADFGPYRFYYTLSKKDEFGEKEEEKSGTKSFDYDIIKQSLVIRTRKKGDQIFLGAGGTQKVKSFFVNQKIPQERRGEIPLLAAEQQILWICGYRSDARYRVTEETKIILKIQMEKGE